MFDSIFKVLFIVSILMQVFFNVQFDLKLINTKHLFLGSPSFPGGPFLGLRPYLKGVRWAGYCADSKLVNRDVDTAFMFFYQRAQFALSPTMLDKNKPLEYEYIILFNKQKLWEEELLSKLKAKVIVRLKGGITLIHKESL